MRRYRKKFLRTCDNAKLTLELVTIFGDTIYGTYVFPFEHREGNVAEKVVAVDCGRVGLRNVSDGKSKLRETNGTFHSDLGRRTARCSLGRREAIVLLA